MKKTAAVLLLAVSALLANFALATPHKKVSDAEVQAAIDARLHEMLVQLNAQHR